MKNFYHVLLKNVPQLLTYESENKIPIGSLIQISLGKRIVSGIIVDETRKPEYQCVSISKVFITEAITHEQVQLCKWMSSYYFASLARCIQLFIPSIIWNQKVLPKRKIHYELNEDLASALEKCKRAKKQQKFVKICTKKGKISESEARNICSSTILKSLINKQIIKKIEGELINPDNKHKSKPYHEQPMTEEQKKVLFTLQAPKDQNSKLSPVIRSFSVEGTINSKPSTFLLHGITGSGKTEIYLQIIKKNIENNRQCILLVPEISLTTELIQYFCAHFPDQISIIHSKLSDREKVQAWHRIHQGNTKLILGSRSALFTPWKNLGAIIIDEEHEWTYKQESSPRYHVRKVSQKICKLISPSPQLILGSATPSLESYFHSKEKNTTYILLKMKKRATKHTLPNVHVVDLREEYKKKNFSMFSDLLQEKILERLEKKEQIILFLNKRGNSSSVTCRDCGYTPKCNDCDITLTYHSKLRYFKNGGLICHYCGSFRENTEICPHCKSLAIRYFGSGTQKAEEQLKKLFPKSRIIRADKDTTSGKYDFEKIYHKMKNQEADILIGTQMIAKGLDLPKITLTGILLADIGLHIPDFRASERVFQLITQAAGRSGRHLPGEVIIQSYQPDHPAIQAAKKHDYEQFYEQEITHRKILKYPPYTKSIKLIFANEDPKKAEEEALHLYEKLHDKHQIKTNQYKNYLQIDMSPNYISKLHGKYIWNILIRGENPRELLKNTSLPSGWKVDVDPQ